MTPPPPDASASLPSNAQGPVQDRLIALIVASAFFMQTLDGSILNTSLPQMARSFGVRPVDLSLGITVYLLAVAACVPASAWLSDRLGARKVFVAAIALFTLASLGCAASTGLSSFVVARAFQGMGGALMTPVGRMVVLRHASKARLLELTSLITWPGLVAPVIGPALGGLLTTYGSWHWNFLLNLPIGLIGITLVLRFVPDCREGAPRRFDLRGFVLTAGALVCLLFGLESFVHASAPVVWSAVMGGMGCICAALSVRHMQRCLHPLLDLSTFKVQTFALCNLWAGGLLRVSIASTPFLLPLMLQLGWGLSPLHAGLLVMVYFAGNLGMKTVTSQVLRRFGFRRVLTVNGLAAGLSIAGCALLQPGLALIFVVALLFAAGLTRSLQFTSLNTLGFADLEAGQRASAATLSSMLQQVSMVLGTALAALLLNLAQQASGRHTLSPSDFEIAFACMGALGMAGAWMFLELPDDAGHEVSGHMR